MQYRKIFFLFSALLGAFALGYATNRFTGDSSVPAEKQGRVTGIGGIFFKSANPDSLKKWYRDNLGLNVDAYGTNFVWYQGADSTKRGSTQWSIFKATTKYFEPSKKEFMINYRVINMDDLLMRLRQANVQFTDSVETVDYGRFVHIMDPDGNKIELWEPNDEAYSKLLDGVTR